MGITGLLPFVKNASRTTNVDEFKGGTVAVDTYCWLHKGAFSCAEKLAMGEKTNGHVLYVMKLVNMLLAKGVKPVMVFDGCRLPSKADVETERRERREQYKKKAAQYLREGKRSEARECFQRCVDITPQMASDVIKACRAAGVDCLVAPYEADAQLTYLNQLGVADLVITEDSDLIPFGCHKILYKMDFHGNGILVERDRLNRVTQIQDNYYSFSRFRQMCILSGCDYLNKLPGVGLIKANKLFKMSSNPDIRKVLRKAPSILNLKTNVSDEYVNSFMRAENTFLHQLVFDPLTRKLVPLTPYPEGCSRKDFDYAGPDMSDEEAYQIALGNINIYTRQPMDNFDPRTYKPPPSKDQWSRPSPSKLPRHQRSIWSRQYKPRSQEDEKILETRESTRSMVVTAQFSLKRARSAVDSSDVKSEEELASLYAHNDVTDQLSKRQKLDDDVITDDISGEPVGAESRPNTQSSFGDTDGDNIDNNNNDKDDYGDNGDDEDEEACDIFEELARTVSTKQSTYFGKKSQENVKDVKTESPRVRNIFAVHKAEKRERLNLDALKTPEKKGTKSRFFAGNSPRKTFLDFMPDSQPEEQSVPLVSRTDDLLSPKNRSSESRGDTPNDSRSSAFSWSKRVKNEAHSQEKPFRQVRSNLSKFRNVKSSSDLSDSKVDDTEWENLRADILGSANKNEKCDSPYILPKSSTSPKFIKKSRKSLQDELSDLVTSPKKSTSPKMTSRPMTSGTRSLQDELSEMVAMEKKEVDKIHEELYKPRNTGCRASGLSRKRKSGKKENLDANQPKLSSFLNRFKNNKFVAKMLPSHRKPLSPSKENVLVDLTDDFEEETELVKEHTIVAEEQTYQSFMEQI